MLRIMELIPVQELDLKIDEAKKQIEEKKQKYLRMKKDVEAAQNIGMKGVWKQDFQWNHVEADAVVYDLSELPVIIHKLSE